MLFGKRLLRFSLQSYKHRACATTGLTYFMHTRFRPHYFVLADYQPFEQDGIGKADIFANAINMIPEAPPQQ